MIYSYIRKGYGFLALAALTIFSLQSNLMAEGLILNHTGTIGVTKSDGVVLVIEPGQALPDIPSGSRVEVLNGGIEVEPVEGFIQLVLGGSVATVKAGDSLSASIDEKTGLADFKVKAGQVNIITGNTTTTIGAGQQVQVGLDKVTGITIVKSIVGQIETVTVGVKVLIPEGSIIKLKADAKTRNVHIECAKGAVNVVAVDGKATELKEGQPLDTPGSAEGEIQTFNEVSRFEPAEEPTQPLRPEGSPYES